MPKSTSIRGGLLCALALVASSCVSIAPYPADWPPRVTSRDRCLDISGTYEAASAVLTPFNSPFPMQERPHSIKLVQNGCQSITAQGYAGSREIYRYEREIAWAYPDILKLRVSFGGGASFLLGYEKLGWDLGLAADGALVMRPAKTNCGLLLIPPFPLCIVERKPWERSARLSR